jgi:pantothenate kinase-related protein Tda10
MTGVMEELALIRREIRAIGININQQTHYFHTTANPNEKWFYVNRTMAHYKSIEDKIDGLLVIVNQLSIKWLQGS